MVTAIFDSLEAVEKEGQRKWIADLHSLELESESVQTLGYHGHILEIEAGGATLIDPLESLFEMGRNVILVNENGVVLLTGLTRIDHHVLKTRPELFVGVPS